MNGEIAPEGLGCSPWQEMVRLLPANRPRPNHKRTESRCNSNRSRPEVRAYEVSGTGTAGAGGNEANGNGFGKQSHERWLCDVWVVRAQPIFPVEGSELEARDGKGEEVDYPEGSSRDVGWNPAGELRPIRLATPPEPVSQNQVKGQGASNQVIRAGHLCRGGRTRLPHQRPCSEGDGPLAVAGHGQNHSDLEAAARCTLAPRAAGSCFAGTRHDKCLASQRTVCSAVEVLQLR